MIRVRVHWIAALSIPMSDLFPSLPAVLCAMQIDAAANHVIGIGRMHDDRIAVRDLPFAFEVFAVNALPTVTAVRAAKNSQQKIFLTAGISASVFGLLFGEIFGFELKQIVPLPAVIEIVHREGTTATCLNSDAVYLLLTITLLIGMTHLILGMSLGIVKKVREHETAELDIMHGDGSAKPHRPYRRLMSLGERDAVR